AAFSLVRSGACLNKHLDALSALSRLDPRHTTRQIDHQFSAPQNVLPLSHDDWVAGKRYSVVFHIENAKLAGRGLIFLRNHDAAARLKTLDALLTAWPRTRGLKCLTSVGWLATLLVEHHQRLATQTGIALLHPYIAAESCLFVFVPDLQSGSLDVHRRIAILREALQGIRRSLRRRLRLRVRSQAARHKSNRKCNNEAGLSHHRCSPAFGCSGWFSVMSITTPPWNRMTSPESTISSRLALSVPWSNLTSTGCSETTFPLRMSTSASLRRP